MKVNKYSHRLLRMSAVLALPLFVAFDVAAQGPPDPAVLCLDVWNPLLLLLFYPFTHESPGPSLAFSVVWLVLFSWLKIAGVPPLPLVAGGSVAAMAYATYRTTGRYSDVPRLFLPSAVLPGVLDHLRLLHLSAFLCCGVCICCAVRWHIAGWAMLPVLLGFFCLQYGRICSRSTLFLGRRKESLLIQANRNVGFRSPVQYVDSDCRSAKLFNEVLSILETKQPYLQEDFSLDDLSRLTHTNRLYLSKAVNFHSGRNFNQLVNYFRIRYAKDLIRKDPKLRMIDVADMCGFHSVVSFNMAFKLNEQMTPGEFARSLKKLTQR